MTLHNIYHYVNEDVAKISSSHRLVRYIDIVYVCMYIIMIVIVIVIVIDNSLRSIYFYFYF